MHSHMTDSDIDSLREDFWSNYKKVPGMSSSSSKNVFVLFPLDTFFCSAVNKSSTKYMYCEKKTNNRNADVGKTNSKVNRRRGHFFYFLLTTCRLTDA